MRSRSPRILSGFLALTHVLCLPLSAQDVSPVAGFSSSVILSDYEQLLREVSYVPDAVGSGVVVNRSSTDTKQGVALVVARTQLRDVGEELLNKLAEQLSSSSQNPNLKLVTLADLTANFKEAKAGAVQKGSLQDFSTNQTALNEAVARGIAMVLFVDLTHFNGKASTVPGAAGVSLLNARASLTLLNAADGVRIKSLDKEVKLRGFDAADLTDKACDSLAKALAVESARWKLPELQIKLLQLEIHAKMDGIQFPMMDIEQTGELQVREVPLFAEGASVEINGLLKGKAPCKIDVAPGTHRLKVYRDGTKPFEATIQVNSDTRYDALLVPSEDTRRKFDEQLRKFEAVKTMALKRNVALEREGVKTEGMRVQNENARLMGSASADLQQSRADVLRKDADSRGKIADGRNAVLNGKAEVLNGKAEAVRKGAEGQLRESTANAEVMQKDADARGRIADGKTAVLNGEAAILDGRAKEQSNLVNAEAEAVRKAAEGQLRLNTADARENTPVLRARLEALKEQSAVFKSFAETLGTMGFKLAHPSRL